MSDPLISNVARFATNSINIFTHRKKVGCVGKGLLFDTGGYNIKTSMVR